MKAGPQTDEHNWYGFMNIRYTEHTHKLTTRPTTHSPLVIRVRLLGLCIMIFVGHGPQTQDHNLERPYDLPTELGRLRKKVRVTVKFKGTRVRVTIRVRCCLG